MPQTSPPDIGQKIKQRRSAKSLTLDQLAVKSGVSKSMLSQIERNKTNPTVATLWSLTRALGIDIGDILGGDNQTKDVARNISYIKSHQTPGIQSADGKCTLRILGPLNMVSHIEWYDVELEQDGLLASEPHMNGTTEHLTVLKGEISVSSGTEKQILTIGDTARYSGDIEHSIKNIGSANAHAILVVYSPE